MWMDGWVGGVSGCGRVTGPYMYTFVHMLNMPFKLQMAVSTEWVDGWVGMWEEEVSTEYKSLNRIKIS